MGRTLEQAAADEGLAIILADSYRTKRPERLSKSRGHGHTEDELVDLGTRLRTKPLPKVAKPLAVPVAPIIPNFLEAILTTRTR